MEFFEYYSIAGGIVSIFVPSTEDFATAVRLQMRMFWVNALVGLAIYLVFLILGGIGLMCMAKRAGIKHVWMGFVPFLNTWYAGHIAGEANFFGQKMKRAGLYAAIFEGIYCVLQFLVLLSNWLTLKFPTEDTRLNPLTGDPIRYIAPNLSEMPAVFRWIFDGELWVTIFGYLAWFVMIVFMCVLFIALFRKYYARSPIMMMLLSTLIPFRGAVIFAVRKNKPVDYNEYMRKKMEEAMRRSMPYGPGPYNNGPYGPGPYNNGPYNNGPYNNGPYNNGAPKAEEPFSDFGSDKGGAGETDGGPKSSDDGPFSDF